MAELENSQANALRVMYVEKCFGSSGESLYQEGRVLLGEGVLTKVCRKSAKPRQFFLFNDLLVYGTIVKDKKKYKNQVQMPLADIGIVSITDTPDIRNAWQITSAKKSFTVFAATPREKAEWVQHLCAMLGRPAALDASKRPDGHAPAWIPDASAGYCMHCTARKFSAVNRRHHCRHCGMVVCAKCSSKRFLLPDLGSKPVRVCDSCYANLTTDSNGAATGGSRRSSTPLSSQQQLHQHQQLQTSAGPSDTTAETLTAKLENASVAGDKGGVGVGGGHGDGGNVSEPEDVNDFSAVGDIGEATAELAALTTDRPTTFYGDESGGGLDTL